MKRISLILSLLITAHLAFAVPARPVWQTITLADGTTVRAIKCGDENFHYFKTDGGMFLLRDADGTFRAVEQNEIETLYTQAPRRQIQMAKRAARNTATAGAAKKSPTRSTNDGEEKRGLVIMVSFSDLDFRDANAWKDWNDILNKDGYNENGAVGSVHDYFKDQSNGLFNLKFDLIGPVKLSKDHYYYGDNGTRTGGLDVHMGELVSEACAAIDDQIDFTKYDWDGDGEVEQVFILYAGCGEHGALNADTRLIWAHECWVTEYPGFEDGITVDNVKIDTYACGSELAGGEADATKLLSGLGTFCHEFSHCLGLPDLYDTSGYNGLDMLDEWDLMSMGCYNLDGWCPPNYSAYEREFCGWQQPIVLDKPTSINELKALGDGGETYKVINDCRDETKIEYYIIENRQQTGWDKSLPGHGVLITHIYYRKLFWDNNAVNTNFTSPGVAFIPANNVKKSSPDVAYPYTDATTGTVNDSLTDNSKPAAKVFNTTKDGKRFMGKPITAIKVKDGIASFDFCKTNYTDTSIESIDANRGTSFHGRPATVYDAQGRLVLHTEAYYGIDNLPSGLYIIKGEDGGSQKVIR